MTIPIAVVPALGVALLAGCGGSSDNSARDSRRTVEKQVANNVEAANEKTSLAFNGNTSTAQPGSGFPAHYAAPYAEAWESPSALKQAHDEAGLKYFNLAFILDAGGCNAKFNGDIALNDPGWISAINASRAAGGDVIASFGGANGKELALTCNSVSSLKAQYKTVVDTLNLTRVDFDIEGKPIHDEVSIDRRNKVLAQLQQEYRDAGRKLDVNYTLSVSSSGLTKAGMSLLKNAKSNGVDVSLVNIMTMDYGTKEQDMGGTAVAAANALHGQLHGLWPSKTDSQLWAMEGNTPMIGVNDSDSEVFSAGDTKKLVDFAKSKGIQQLSFWSLRRDQMCGAGRFDPSTDCSGTVQSAWQFSRLFKGIGDDGTLVPTQGDPAPQPKPIPQKTPHSRPSPPTPTTPSPSTAPHTESPFHVTGQVRCESGHPVVGVWVQAAHSSDSRFAAWRGVGNGSSADWWTDLPKNERYSLHVGCGGTPDRWDNENQTQTVSGSRNSFNCDDIAGDPNYKKCARR